jgi:hypothetical protein
MTVWDELAAVTDRARQEGLRLEAALQDCQRSNTALRSEVEGLRTHAAQLEAELRECRARASKVDLGLWPAGPDYETLLADEAAIRRKASAFRERGGRGGLTTPLYKAGMVRAVSEGRNAQLELNCRLRTSNDYVPFAEVLSGRYDAQLRQRAAEAKALPGGPWLFELQSEADLEAHNSGTPREYRAFCRYVRRLFEAEGVTNLLYTTSLLTRQYERGGWERWIDLDVIDVIAVDGYSTPSMTFGGRTPGVRRELAEIAGPCLVVAHSVGRPMAVCETGCQEDLRDPAYKPGWYARALAWVKANRAEIVSVTWNTSADGPGDVTLTWHPNSSPASLEAFRALAASPVWR